MYQQAAYTYSRLLGQAPQLPLHISRILGGLSISVQRCDRVAEDLAVDEPVSLVFLHVACSGFDLISNRIVSMSCYFYLFTPKSGIGCGVTTVVRGLSRDQRFCLTEKHNDSGEQLLHLFTENILYPSISCPRIDSPKFPAP